MRVNINRPIRRHMKSGSMPSLRNSRPHRKKPFLANDH